MNVFSIKENSCLAKIAAWKLKGKKVAIVFGNRIHLYGVSKEKFLQNERWLRHELKHVEQFQKHGVIPLLVKYLWHSLFHGYHNCCFEKEAREAENDESLLEKYTLAGPED